MPGYIKTKWIQYGPRLAENQAMFAMAVNLFGVSTALATPQGLAVLAGMSWAQCGAAAACWAAATYPIQRAVANGSQTIYIENQRKWKLGFTLNRQVAIVTGASSGIGYELALMLAQLDCDVIMACRDEAKAKKAIKDAEAHVSSLTHKLQTWPGETQFRDWGRRQQGHLRYMHLDLSDEESISNFAKQVNAEYEDIHILVNNGGVFSTASEQISKSGHELQLETNALGPYLLTELLLPKIRRRIVNVTSASHKMPEANAEADFIGILDNIQYSAVAAERETKKAAGEAVVDETKKNVETPAKNEATTEENEKHYPSGDDDQDAEMTQRLLAKKKRAEREAGVESRIVARGLTLEEARDVKTSLVYGPSKLINLFHVRELSRRLRGRGILSVGVHPGGVTTDIFRDMPIAKFFIQIGMPFFFKTPVQGARSVLTCCVGEDIDNGAFYADSWPAETAASELSKSRAQQEAAMMWCSEQWDYRVPLNENELVPIDEIEMYALYESKPQPYIRSTDGPRYADHILPDI